MTSSAAPRRSVTDGAMGLPLSVEPPPVGVPANVQPSTGASTTPATARPSIQRPSDTEKSGRPCAKFVVPSSGSTYHTRAPGRACATVVPSSATMRSSGTRARPLDDERLGPLVVLGDEVDVLGLEPDGGPRAPPRDEDLPRLARDLDGHGASVSNRLQAATRRTRRARYRSLRIHVAAFERASRYSAVCAMPASTSLQSMATKPSFSPK